MATRIRSRAYLPALSAGVLLACLVTESTPSALTAAVKARMLADVDLVKAELAYREAHVQVMSLIGAQDCPVPARH
jgi:hypothetical protein